MTQILESLTGKPIVADIVRQHPMAAAADNALGLAVGHSLIHRSAVLRGGAGTRPFVYAESTFAPDRLPERVQEELAGTSKPIGRILAGHGFALARAASPSLADPEQAPAVTVGDGANEVILARAYLLLLNDLPVFAIREWFFDAVLDLFDQPGPA